MVECIKHPLQIIYDEFAEALDADQVALLKFGAAYGRFGADATLSMDNVLENLEAMKVEANWLYDIALLALYRDEMRRLITAQIAGETPETTRLSQMLAEWVAKDGLDRVLYELDLSKDGGDRYPADGDDDVPPEVFSTYDIEAVKRSDERWKASEFKRAEAVRQAVEGTRKVLAAIDAVTVVPLVAGYETHTCMNCGYMAILREHKRLVTCPCCGTADHLSKRRTWAGDQPERGGSDERVPLNKLKKALQVP